MSTGARRGGDEHDAPVVLEQPEADADEWQHEVQAERVAVGELAAAVRKAGRPRHGRELFGRREARGEGGGEVGDERDEGREREGEVEEVVEDDREGDDERLRDLYASRSSARVSAGDQQI